METQVQPTEAPKTTLPTVSEENVEISASTSKSEKVEESKVEEAVESPVRVYHLNTLNSVLMQRTRNGSSIKDIRVLKSLVGKINAMLPKDIPAPANLAADATDEQKAEHKKTFEAWMKEREALVSAPVVPKFTPQETTIIKRRLSTFSGFLDDPEASDRILVLADYFGV